MDRTPKPGEIYRHFKNRLYQIIAVARHTETEELLVIYQALYGSFQVYARPLSMFVSEVDRVKYPSAGQRYRFEKVDRECLRDLEPEETGQREPERKQESDKSAGLALGQEEQPDMAPASGLNPLLLSFVESEDYGVKLELLSAMEGKVSQADLDALHEALDLPGGDGDIERQMQSVKQYLKMRMKFDGGRLR